MAFKSSILFFCFCVIVTKGIYGQADLPLLAAIRANDSIKMKALLHTGAPVNVADEYGDNALMYAVLYSPPDCVKQLLDKGADPNAKNRRGETPLMWSSHDIEKTRLMLSHRANVNAVSQSGNTALLIACTGTDRQPVINLLLAHGADPLVTNNKKQNCLMRVASLGDTSTARIFLNKGIDINAKNIDGESALFEAVKYINTPMVLWLLQQGIDANQTDVYKSKAVTYSFTKNDPVMVDALLKKTTDINAQDIDGMTILMWAVYSEYDSPAIIQYLLTAGASLDLKDKNGDTALAWALRKGNTATVALLQKAGAK